MVLPTNFGVEVVVKGLGRVATITSVAFLRGGAPLETWTKDRKDAWDWALSQGFTITRPVLTNNLPVRQGTPLRLPARLAE